MSSRIGPMALGHKEESIFLGVTSVNIVHIASRRPGDRRGNTPHYPGAFDKAYNVLLQNKTRLITISERLIKEETLEGPLFEALFNQQGNDGILRALQ